MGSGFWATKGKAGCCYSEECRWKELQFSHSLSLVRNHPKQSKTSPNSLSLHRPPIKTRTLPIASPRPCAAAGGSLEPRHGHQRRREAPPGLSSFWFQAWYLKLPVTNPHQTSSSSSPQPPETPRSVLARRRCAWWQLEASPDQNRKKRANRSGYLELQTIISCDSWAGELRLKFWTTFMKGSKREIEVFTSEFKLAGFWKFSGHRRFRSRYLKV